MLIEKELLRFAPFQIAPEQNAFVVQIADKAFRLSQLQGTYLQTLVQDKSIEAAVQSFLKRGWLVNFRELYILIEFLVQQKIILNQTVHDYFTRVKSVSQPSATKWETSNSGTDEANVRKKIEALPFFRSLDKKILDVLLNSTSYYRLSSKTQICRSGDNSRDMFVLTKGTCSIYKLKNKNEHQWVAHLTEGSVFGEGGFFLNQARSADIIADTEIELIRIRYNPQTMDNLIQQDKAQALQIRFWVLHALNRSSLFKEIPSDCLDALVYKGRVVQTQANQVLFQQGQVANSFYFVIQGQIDIVQNSKLINKLGQGDSLGEVGLILNSGQRSASAICTQACLLLEISANDFYSSLGQNLFLARELEQLAEDRLRQDQSRR